MPTEPAGTVPGPDEAEQSDRRVKGTIRTGAGHDDPMAKTTEPALTTTLSVDPASIGAAIVEEMNEFIAMFDGDLRFVGANRSLCDALGHRVEDLLGTPALDLVAPSHRDRAGMILGIAQQQGTMAGGSPFDMMCADGSILPVQVTGSDVVIGDERVLVVIGRPAHDMIAIGLVLDRLLANEDLDSVLAPLLDLFAWRLAGSRVAITWSSSGIRESVSTSLPDALTGMGHLDADGPWAQALRFGAGSMVMSASCSTPTGRLWPRTSGWARSGWNRSPPSRPSPTP